MDKKIAFKRIHTYQINGKWCVRVHGKALCGTSKTQDKAYQRGECHLIAEVITHV